MSDRFYCHHAGGRGGSFATPVAAPFRADYVVYSYEPDKDCVAQIQAMVQAQQIDIRVVPMALGDRPGRRDININYDAYTSSILPSNPATGAYQRFWHMDYLVAEVTRTERVVGVDMTTIDEVRDQSGEPVDVLSIDTQGFEYEVLLGADRAVRETAVAVICEVSFVQFYKGQHLFGDIHNWLNERGLHLDRVLHWTDMATFRAPLGWRAASRHVHGDVLFLKASQAIVATHPKPIEGLFKLAFVTLLHDNLELSLEALLAARRLPGYAEAVAGTQRAYVRFLGGMLDIYESRPHMERPLFSDTLTLEEAFARFRPDPPEALRNGWGPGFRDRYLSRIDRALFRAEVDQLAEGRPTDIEEYLSLNGFGNLANVVAGGAGS